MIWNHIYVFRYVNQQKASKGIVSNALLRCIEFFKHVRWDKVSAVSKDNITIFHNIIWLIHFRLNITRLRHYEFSTYLVILIYPEKSLCTVELWPSVSKYWLGSVVDNPVMVYSPRTYNIYYLRYFTLWKKRSLNIATDYKFLSSIIINF